MTVIVAGCAEPDPEAAVAPSVSPDPAVVSPLRIAPGDLVEPISFSPDGRFAVFHTVTRAHEGHPAPLHLVVDTSRWTSVQIADADELMFARDGRHAAARIEHEVAFVDLATGDIDARRWPISNELVLGDDGRFLWASRGSDRWQLHAYDAATAAHDVVGEVPFRDRVFDELGHDAIGLASDERDHIAATAYGGLTIWAHGAPTQLDTSRCGTIRSRNGIGTCTRGRIVTSTVDHRACIWDVQRETLVQTIDPPWQDSDFTCRGELVEARRAANCAVYSLATGRRLTDLCTLPASSSAEASYSLVPVRPAVPSPVGELVATANDGRGELWTVNGRVWQLPSPSDASAVTFDDDTLVIAGRRGELWRFALGTRVLSTSELHGCLDPEAVAIAPNQRAVAICADVTERSIVAEGADRPLDRATGVLWPATLVPTPTSSLFVWSAEGHTRLWDVAAGARASPSYPGEGYVTIYQDIAMSPDRKRRVTVLAGSVGMEITLLDEYDARITTRRTSSRPEMMAFSPDGTRFAMSLWSYVGFEIVVLDTMSGRLVDGTLTADRAIAWERGAEARLAIVRPGGIIALRDVEARRDDAIRILPGLHDSLNTLVWSRRGELAAIGGSAIALWPPDSINASMIQLSGASGIEIRPDSSAHLLGDHAAARDLYRCRSGDRTVPRAWCDVKLDEP